MEALSVEQLQQMVELEEKTKVIQSYQLQMEMKLMQRKFPRKCNIVLHFQAGYFEGMTELEKYKMYKKAQMMLAIKKLKAEEKAVEEMVAEEEVGF